MCSDCTCVQERDSRTQTASWNQINAAVPHLIDVLPYDNAIMSFGLQNTSNYNGGVFRVCFSSHDH